ncbi:MAG TPA: hypothetical protein RMH99_18930 [Sandaracinaceae bacterium LLY-WYZ-13_1]|nr:hypothetical protein [Sandaracinaceae bacterium LLY-WYZ-13_1]
MRMRGWFLRVFRVVLVGGAAWLAFQWLEPRGLGWVVLLVAGLLVAMWIGLRAARIRGQRAEEARAERWAEALMIPPRRPAAVRELNAELDALDPSKPKQAHRFAHLSLILAELLEADGEPEKALEALDRIDDESLAERMAAVVRHARAVSWLSAGDPASARAALDELPGPCGDRAVDLRIRMMRGLIAAEEGDPEEALEIAQLARTEAGTDADLKLEARVLKAVALDAAGDPEDARKVLAALEDEMLEVLHTLGLPRVRRLAGAILQERED